MLRLHRAGAIYNAINFNWTCWYGTGQYINSTVFESDINVFMCPSDGLAGIGHRILPATATVTVTTLAATAPRSRNGAAIRAARVRARESSLTCSAMVSSISSMVLQTRWRSRKRSSRISRTSRNTAMELPPGRPLPTPTSMVPRRFRSARRGHPGPSAVRHWFQTQQNPPWSDDKGIRWGTGSPGVTLFNSIVPPNSSLYSFAGCRFGCGGCGFEIRQLRERLQQPPRRLQRHDG